MDVRVGLLVLLVLAGNWVSDAAARNIKVLQVSGVEESVENLNLCALCEEYVTVAVNYRNDDKTQAEVMEALHNSCSQMRNLADECTRVVDQYTEIFFSNISMVQPEGFCKSVGLCRKAMVSILPSKRDKCEVCQQAMNEVLDKLKDPDTELEIIERLLKACNSVGDKYKRKCKKMVFEFGPVILVDACTFVEKLDLCTTFRACARQPTKTVGMVTSSSS